MAHELRSVAGTELSAMDIARRLKAEFSYVRVDAQDALNKAKAQAEWIERAPPSLFLGQHKSALDTAARLKSLMLGDALTIEFGDDPTQALRISVIPGEAIKFGYSSNDEQAIALPMVERCAKALGYQLIRV